MLEIHEFQVGSKCTPTILPFCPQSVPNCLGYFSRCKEAGGSSFFFVDTSQVRFYFCAFVRTQFAWLASNIVGIGLTNRGEEFWIDLDFLKRFGYLVVDVAAK